MNLCENSDLCAWYISHVDFSRIYSREELDGALALEFPQYTATIRENAMKAFQNMLKESILGHEIPIGILSKEKNKVSYQRGAYNQLSLAGVAYSLYRYAEKVGRKSLTISELYNENQTEGIYRQFGIDRNSLEKKLRSLHEEGNQVLKVELMMGLDNITLREDLTSLDILKMLL
jgi:phosphoadenosine phosphosulfate reductase